MPSIFVYGTLKQHQERGTCWPRAPRRIVVARVRGRLYDLLEYPAMLTGDDWVEGERWEFDEGDLGATLAELDEIEGYADRPDDLYRRIQLPVFDVTPTGLQPAGLAAGYVYADPQALTDAQRIAPDSNGICRWPRTVPREKQEWA